MRVCAGLERIVGFRLRSLRDNASLSLRFDDAFKWELDHVFHAFISFAILIFENELR